MLIYHGQNTVVSRNRLHEKIASFSGEVIRFEGEKLSLVDLKQSLESSSLFGAERLVVVENLFSRRPSRAKEEILKYLKWQMPKNLLIWEGKDIDGRTLKPFGITNSLKFAIPAQIFNFLDSLDPTNKKNSLSILHQCQKTTPAEIIFFMLSRHIRYLIIASDLGEKGLDEFPSWRSRKYVFQAKKFGLKKLISFYHQLLMVDYQQKTGRSSLPLLAELDLLIANL